MTWFKVDDGFAFHRKAVRAGNAAIGLWVRAGSWCSDHETDGHLPLDVARLLGTDKQAGRLVLADLWVQVDDGYLFHDWSECNPTRAELEAARKRAALNQQKSRASKKISAADGNFSETNENFSAEIPESPRSEASVSDDSLKSQHDDIGSGRGSRSSAGSEGEGKRDTRSKRSISTTDPDFVLFWQAYPKKVAKPEALKAWIKAVADRRDDPKKIIAAAQAYAASPKRKPDYTANPATWINQERYDDGPDERDAIW